MNRTLRRRREVGQDRLAQGLELRFSKAHEARYKVADGASTLGRALAMKRRDLAQAPAWRPTDLYGDVTPEEAVRQRVSAVLEESQVGVLKKLVDPGANRGRGGKLLLQLLEVSQVIELTVRLGRPAAGKEDGVGTQIESSQGILKAQRHGGHL